MQKEIRAAQASPQGKYGLPVYYVNKKMVYVWVGDRTEVLTRKQLKHAQRVRVHTMHV